MISFNFTLLASHLSSSRLKKHQCNVHCVTNILTTHLMCVQQIQESSCASVHVASVTWQSRKSSSWLRRAQKSYSYNEARERKKEKEKGKCILWKWYKSTFAGKRKRKTLCAALGTRTARETRQEGQRTCKWDVSQRRRCDVDAVLGRLTHSCWLYHNNTC